MFWFHEVFRPHGATEYEANSAIRALDRRVGEHSELVAFRRRTARVRCGISRPENEWRVMMHCLRMVPKRHIKAGWASVENIRDSPLERNSRFRTSLFPLMYLSEVERHIRSGTARVNHRELRCPRWIPTLRPRQALGRPSRTISCALCSRGASPAQVGL